MNELGLKDFAKRKIYMQRQVFDYCRMLVNAFDGRPEFAKEFDEQKKDYFLFSPLTRTPLLQILADQLSKTNEPKEVNDKSQFQFSYYIPENSQILFADDYDRLRGFTQVKEPPLQVNDETYFQMVEFLLEMCRIIEMQDGSPQIDWSADRYVSDEIQEGEVKLVVNLIGPEALDFHDVTEKPKKRCIAM